MGNDRLEAAAEMARGYPRVDEGIHKDCKDHGGGTGMSKEGYLRGTLVVRKYG